MNRYKIPPRRSMSVSDTITIKQDNQVASDIGDATVIDTTNNKAIDIGLQKHARRKHTAFRSKNIY